MKTIWKFPLQLVSPQFIEMPDGAEILTVQSQGDVGCLWALVDPEMAVTPRYFEVFGTGQNVHTLSKRRYIGTFQQPPFVWHVFERL